jgi:hypothetical protein
MKNGFGVLEAMLMEVPVIVTGQLKVTVVVL